MQLCYIRTMKESGNSGKFNNSSAYRKNLDLMKLLVSSDKFQEILKTTREYMGIPNGGVPRDAESIKNWSYGTGAKTDKMRQSALFRDALKSLHEKLESKKITPKECERELKALHYKLPVNYLTWTIDFIIERFNLPKHFAYFIRQYIVFNKLSAPTNNFAIVTRADFEGKDHESIEIYAKLTNDELTHLKRYLDSYLETKLPNVLPIKNLDANLEVENWVKDKEKVDVISGESYTMTYAEIAENLLGGKHQAKKVYDILDGLDHQRHKQFGQFLEDSETTT